MIETVGVKIDNQECMHFFFFATWYSLCVMCGDLDEDNTSNDDANDNEELNDKTRDAIGEFEAEIDIEQLM